MKDYDEVGGEKSWSHVKVQIPCRFCGSYNLKNFLELGNLPLVNNLLNSKDEAHRTYPLNVDFCQDCTMSQLSIVIDPEILYSNYYYRSGMSQTFKNHCSTLAAEILSNFSWDSTVLSIAENDGTFLENFKKSTVSTIGVEPATNLCKIAEEKGITMVNKFFDYSTALDITIKYGQADAIVAQNVFAHVDNVYEFMTSARMLLKDHGVLIIECPWSGSTIENTDFGQIYHEHLSYISVKGMTEFVKKFGLKVSKITYFDVLHCGTIRYYIHHDHYNTNISNLWEIDNAIYREKIINDNITKCQENLNIQRNQLKEYLANKKVVGVGASAKGTILCNVFDLAGNIEAIYDSTPEKIGKFQPGTTIPILDFKEITNTDKDIIILAPNWSKEIINNVRKLNKVSKFIIPTPKLEIIS